MPTITISFEKMQKLLGKKMRIDELQEVLLTYLKADSELKENDELYVELIDTNRPELWGVEGLVRELRYILGLKSKQYQIKKSNFSVIVDSKVKNIRPEIACAVVKGVKFDDQIIKDLMQLQDKLDTGYGRKRKRTSIGLYNLDLISFPVKYKTVMPDSVKFVPLGFEKEMNPKDILKHHPKGVEYGHIISGRSEVPLLIDSKKNILSLPPIINSNSLGKVDAKTKNVFIEVTGTNHDTVLNTLNIVTSALAEYGEEIYSVVIDDKKKFTTPDFSGKKHEVELIQIEKMLGFDIKPPELKKLLEKMGYELIKISKDKLLVEAPFYRKDIMHQVDIIEDIAIAYDYNKIEPMMPQTPSVGKLRPETLKQNLIREFMIGMGQQEILSFVLTSKQKLIAANLKNKPAAEIENPLSSNYDILRNTLLPNILDFLAKNKTVEFPQKIFELGDVVIPNQKHENSVEQRTILCSAITHPKANFTEIKSVLDTLAINLKREVKIRHASHASFIDGRCGEVWLDGRVVGIIGEIHPQVLANFGFENPVVLFEVDVDAL